MISRRSFLRNTAAAGAVGAVVAAPAIVEAGSENAAAAENPSLIEAWKTFRGAETEKKAAKDALEWLADEWKHRWPLAPEEILGGANANERSDPELFTIERDILGRAIRRDCSVLTKRLSKEFRAETKECCFFIETPQRLAEWLDEAEKRVPRGRTEKALARNQKFHTEYLARLRIQFVLSTRYFAEIASIRAAASVEQVEARVEKANIDFEIALDAVFAEPAHTLYGARLKADALYGYCECMHVRCILRSAIGTRAGLKRYSTVS